MDSDPPPLVRELSEDSFYHSRIDKETNDQIDREEDPYSLSGPTIALIGLAIAIATLGIPLAAVFTDRPGLQEKHTNSALELDGFKTTSPIAFSRFSKPNS
tara:strand:- start:338 stop:640 length:303 start_codon:yes stop_codon:yes gene_type:complete